jgi:hypothetical protein
MEKVEVNVVFEGRKENFHLDVGREESLKCNDGQEGFWGWFPYSGPGGGNAEPDCPVTCGDVIDIQDDCRIAGE